MRVVDAIKRVVIWRGTTKCRCSGGEDHDHRFQEVHSRRTRASTRGHHPLGSVQQIAEILGLDLDKEAITDLQQARRDRKMKNQDAYVDLDEIQ